MPTETDRRAALAWLVPVAAVLVSAATIGGIFMFAQPRRDRRVDPIPHVGPTPTGASTLSPAPDPGRNPLLEKVFSLPRCESAEHLAAWLSVGQGGGQVDVTGLSIEEAAASTPIVAAVGGARCAIALRIGRVVGWEVRFGGDKEDNVVRGSSSDPLDGDTPFCAPNAILGSGQAVCVPVVTPTSISAKLGRRGFTVESLVPTVTVSATDLYIPRLEPLTPSQRFLAPTRLPAGYMMCRPPGADLAAGTGRQSNSYLVIGYCHMPYSDFERIEVVRHRVGAGELTPSDPLGAIDVPLSDVSKVAHTVVTTSIELSATSRGVDGDTLTRVLASVPALATVALHPRVGESTYTGSRDEAWYRNGFGDAGASAIVAETAVPGARPEGTIVLRGTAGDGSGFILYGMPVAGPLPPAITYEAARVVSRDETGTDIFVAEAEGADAPTVHQIHAACGPVTVAIGATDDRATDATLLQLLGGLGC